MLQGIVAYDRCEKNDAYIGQINMITVSSFTGPNSGVWKFEAAEALFGNVDNRKECFLPLPGGPRAMYCKISQF